ncbi:MAG: PhoH family protein [Chitinophagales bacterium]|nr:PhoH family protein [Chitinophagales bacterium]
MIESTILLQDIDPLVLYGVNNNKLDLLKKAFPLLKMVFRGDKIKVTGKEEEIAQFELKMRVIVEHIKQYQDITLKDIERITLSETPDTAYLAKPTGDVIVYGNNGHVVRARTPNQKVMVEQNLKNDILFAIGPAGTGKTYTAVALAVKAWKEKQVKRIILTRPAVEAGENLGFLPGDLREKVDPYLRPLYDALEDMIPFDKLTQLKETRIIEVAPLAFMRGRTLDNAFIILDEAQNATSMQLKMFLTRIGPNAKCIVTGDITQIDLPKTQQSGLPFTLRILDGIEGIGIVRLTNADVIRHRLVAKIISAFENNAESHDKNSR